MKNLTFTYNRKHGYTVYCTLEDYPDGYSRYKLQKQL